MEFKPNNRRGERDRIKIPERDSSSGKLFAPTPITPSVPIKKTTAPKDLAMDRQTLGFDDIPVGDESMDGVRFRDIFRAWTKQSIKNTPIEKKLQEAKTKKSRIKDMTNDLKWALQADLDEPVKPSQKPANKRPLQPVTNVKSQEVVTAQLESAANKSIDININLGSLPKLPKLKTPSPRAIFARIQPVLFRKKVLFPLGATLAIAICFVGVTSVVKLPGAPNSGSSAISNSSPGKPDYGTFIPDGKSIDTLGGWKRVSPADKNPVFAYSDTIGKVAISVSQQPLPDSFHPDVDDQVAKLAKSFSATDEFDAAGTKVYVGTSAKGPQSVIFARNDTLVLIKSQSKVSDETWGAYVKSLK